MYSLALPSTLVQYKQPTHEALREKMSDGLVCHIINMAIEVEFRHKKKAKLSSGSGSYV